MCRKVQTGLFFIIVPPAISFPFEMVVFLYPDDREQIIAKIRQTGIKI